MSKPSALPSPDEPRQQPGARPRPRPGPRARSRRRPRAASAAGATPPDDSITAGSGSPRSARGLAEPAEVAVEQGREVGVDDRRRAALVLAELRQHLDEAETWTPSSALAQALGDRALVRRARGRRTAGRSRSTRPRGPPPRWRSGRARPRLERPRPRRRGRPARRASMRSAGATSGLGQRRAEAVEARAGSGGAISSRSAKPARGDQRRARAAPLEQGVGADGHPVGEASRRRPASAPARSSAASIAVDHAASDWSSGVVGALAV